MRVLHRCIITQQRKCASKEEGEREVRSAPTEDEHASDGKEGGHGTPCEQAKSTSRPLLGQADKLESALTVQT